MSPATVRANRMQSLGMALAVLASVSAMPRAADVPVVSAFDPVTGEATSPDVAWQQFTPASEPISAAGGVVQMNLVQTLPIQLGGPVWSSTSPIGFDTDHDGRREFTMKKLLPSSNGTFYFYESVADNTFGLPNILVTKPEDTAGWVYATDIGDGDADGLADMTTVWKFAEDYAVRVYESLSPSAYPSRPVWSVVGAGPFVGVQIADTDQDGHREIVTAHMTTEYSKLLIYENEGNNVYSLVYEGIYPDLFNQSMTVADDLDDDGKQEILVGGFDANSFRVEVFENVGDNAYDLVGTLFPWYGCCGVNVNVLRDCGDLDGDGKKELLLGGLSGPQPFHLVLLLLEATGDDQFEVVATFSKPYGVISGQDARVADVDGDGKKEIVFGAEGNAAWIYRNTGDNAWQEIWSAPVTNYFTGIAVGDHDGDGKAEIIFLGANNVTQVWEIDQAYAADLDGDGRVDAVDNCPTAGNPGQENADGDVAGNACDCAPNDGAAFSWPSEVAKLGLGSSKTALSWVSQATQSGSGTVYDVVRGDLAGLPVGSTPMNCVEPGSTDTTATDASALGPGVGYYYLVRATNVCGAGTYGSDSAGSEEVSAACP